MDKRGNISDRLKQVCAYADDIAIIARTKKALIETFETLVTDAKKHGLIINQMITKYVQNSKENRAVKDMKIRQMKFEQVKSFKYFGTQQNSHNSTHEEIQCRLISGNKTLYANKQLLSSTSISRNAKLKIYKSLIRSVVTYGCESWTLTKAEEEKLRIFEHKIIRKIYGPIQEPNGYRGIRTSNETKEIIKGEDIVKFIKSQRIR